jgi:hypothetical protein
MYLLLLGYRTEYSLERRLHVGRIVKPPYIKGLRCAGRSQISR